MNFGNISNRLQRYERAKAKLNEFYVSEESRKSNKLGQTSSTELLYSTIRVLSQFAEAYCNDNDKCAEQYNDLSFVASFYENYVVGERTGDDYFFLLIGAIANILSDNFGNAKSLINKICREKIDNEIAILLFEYMANGLGKTYEVLYTCEELRDEYYYHLIDEIVHDTGSVYLYKLRKFSNELLSRNDSESAFYGLMLWAIHKKFLENSAARIIPISAASTLQDWYDYFSQKYAIDILNTIDEYLQNHSEMYDKSVFCEEQWIKSVIDLVESCFDNNHPFNKLDYDVRSVVLQAWVNGESYKNIVNTCNLTIDKAIRVCNKMSYSFNLLISAVNTAI